MKPALLRLTIAAIFAMLCPIGLQALPTQQGHRKYTEEHPLVYIDTWDLPPYVFLNEEGEPDGYTIDVLKLMLQELDIPYVIKLKPTVEAQADFASGASDLLVGNKNMFPDVSASMNSVVQYAYSVACPKNMDITIRSIKDLANQMFYVRKGSRYFEHIKEAGLENHAIPLNDMSDALKKVCSEQKGLVVWNSLSIKWFLRKYQIENLKVLSIDFPQVGYQMLSRDSVLTHRLDSIYTVLNATERLHPLQAKWFYPERMEENVKVPRWVWHAIGLTAVLAIMLLSFQYIFRVRERRINLENKRRNARLALILKVSKVRLWTYNVDKKVFTWYDKEGQPQLYLTVPEAAARCHPNLFTKIEEGIRKIERQEVTELDMDVREKDESNLADQEYHDFHITLSVLRMRRGKPSIIIGVKSDLTEDRKKQRHSKMMLGRYKAIFSNSMVDMVYYDNEGSIVNMNERAQNTFHVTLKEAMLKFINLFDNLRMSKEDIEDLDYYYATEFLDRNGKGRDTYNPADTMYYELQLVPMRDKKNRLLGIYGTGRDVSEPAQSYHRIQQGINELKRINQSAVDYVNNINYVMKAGGIRIVTYQPDSHTLSLYGKTDHVQQELTQMRCLNFVDEKDKRATMRLFTNMDDRQERSLSISLGTVLRNDNFQKLYLQFHFIPITDKSGAVINYFGMCRDVSEMKATEARLEQETLRAQEVEELKNSFLRNMSYEIRTPLNAVMGFSELLDQEYSTEEQAIFINEMKNNANHLLTLINDILFLSRLDANMIEITPQPTDFAATFEAHCNNGWMHNQQEGVRYVTESPYEHLVVNIDDTNVGRIIEQIVANAAQHTTSGSVSARYEYVADKLIITITDTGCGMSQKTLDNIYKRFTTSQQQSTGLGMPICQELATQMGSSIDINSKEGRGTTVWITIPCEATAIDRKTV